MYKGRISWLQIAYGTILLLYGLMMLSNSLGIINILGSHINYSTPSILIIISIILLIGSSKGIGLRISIENGVLIVEKFSKRVEINLSR